MSDKPTNASDKIEEKLNVGNFASDQAKTLGFTFGGMGLGWFAGSKLADTKFADWLREEIFSSSKVVGNAEKLAQQLGHQKLETSKVIKIGSATTGFILGSMVAGYEHWKRVRRQQFGVEEINKDVASIMENRAELEQTLDTQAEFIKRLVAEKNPEHHPHSHAEREHHRQHNKAETEVGVA